MVFSPVGELTDLLNAGCGPALMAFENRQITVMSGEKCRRR
jgi:hypothetical protein